MSDEYIHQVKMQYYNDDDDDDEYDYDDRKDDDDDDDDDDLHCNYNYDDLLYTYAPKLSLKVGMDKN